MAAVRLIWLYKNGEMRGPGLFHSAACHCGVTVFSGAQIMEQVIKQVRHMSSVSITFMFCYMSAIMND